MAFEINKTELVWPGKYDEEGNLVQPPRVSLPFQVIERVNETRATREAKKAAGLTLFDVWDGKNEGSTFEDGWRNKLIWGDNALVMSSLLKAYAGAVDLIYIDPPFDVGADFSVEIEVGDQEILKTSSTLEEVAYRDTWGRGEASYVSVLSERLRLMRELLSENGVLFVHVDYRTQHLIRSILNEIFGHDAFVNEIIWAYPAASAATTRFFTRSHNVIFLYCKTPGMNFFDENGKDVKMPFSDRVRDALKKDEDGRWYYIRGGSIGGKKLADRVYVADPESGMFPRDVWTDIPYVRARTDEFTGYPTQKPEKLLTRIIASSTKPGDLVADFFCGSGTTLSVAEKLGRRWIGTDLGRFAIHTSRKRLLEIQDCKPFEILNLGRYERQFWSTANFGEDLDGDGRVNLLEYIAFILKAYGAEPIAGSSFLHGKQGDAYVHVGSVSSPITNADINAAAQECQNLKGKKVHILGWEWEMGLHDPLVGLLKKELGIEVVLRQIPNEIMEAEAVRKGQIKFFDLAYVEVEVEPKGKSGEFFCKLKDFSSPNTDLVPEEVRKQITKWSDYVDYWAIDWNFQNDTFKHDFVEFRTRQDRSLKLKSDPFTYDKPGTYQVLVKVIDIFGNDTSTIVELKVK